MKTDGVPPDERNVLFVRHGQSIWNDEGRWQGWGDPGLSEAGAVQAARAAAQLDGEFSFLVSSDLKRAHQTAEILRAALGLPAVHIEPGFREIDVGRWTGLTSQEIEERFPGALAEWRGGTLPAPHGGEPRTEFLRRILEAAGRLAGLAGGRTVLVCTHGGVIIQLDRHLGIYDGTPIPNLSGRWYRITDATLVPGERVRLSD